MLEFVLNLFFPPICGICGEKNLNWLCDKCKMALYEKKVTNIINIYNLDYEYFGYLFFYKDLRKKILDYKFNDMAYLCHMFSRIILDDKIIVNKIKDYDLIISVPMSKKKKAIRGYNQTELICKIISKKLGIEYVDCLYKAKENMTQSKLCEKDRKINVRNVFDVRNGQKIRGKKVVLFDDILTTGATVQECSRILKQCGCEEIFVLVLVKN